MVCKVLECNTASRANGYCNKHNLRYQKYGDPTYTKFSMHGKSRTPEYTAWIAMIGRCTKPEYHNYEDYGGRGIKVCQRWLSSFEDFLSDTGNRPSNKYSIDRIDVDGDYEPKNCRWATRELQGTNKRQSSHTKSGIRGVNFNKASGKWRVTIGTTYIGQYANIDEAVTTRQEQLSFRVKELEAIL